jgi:ELWxxDGT repeat protein
LTVFNNEVLFSAGDTLGFQGLWVTNGTAAGTSELTNAVTSPSDFTLVDGELLFSGTNAVGQENLWETDGTAAGTHQLNVSGASINPGLEPQDLTPYIVSVPPPDNFNANNTSDILYTDNTTGDIGFYQINNGVNVGWTRLTGPSTAYWVVGTGDSPVPARPTSCSATTLPATPDFTRPATAPLPAGTTSAAPRPPTAWPGLAISPAAELRILFSDSATGDFGYYAMSNGVTTWHDVAIASTAYSVVGVGDFNGPGVDDILFRDNATGTLGFYEMNNGKAWVVVRPPIRWSGTGDFFGNGTDDILFRDDSASDTGFYAISNGVNTGWHDIGGSSTGYSVVAVGDYNGDNTSDILFRDNTTGDTDFYAMVNGVNIGWHDIGGSSTAYHVVS